MTMINQNDDVGIDIEKNERRPSKAKVVVVEKSEQDEDPSTVATSVCGIGSNFCRIQGGGISVSASSLSVISVEPSIFQLATAEDVEDPDTRQASLCFGCCCDLLRACVIVNILFICFNVVGLLLSWWGISYLNSIDLTDVNDDYQFDYNERVERSDTIFLIALIQQCLGILFAIFGIFGAAKYNKVLVIAMGVWYCLDLIAAGVLANYLGAIIRGFFAYPHFALFMALKSGQITPETYQRESHCCCTALQTKS